MTVTRITKGPQIDIVRALTDPNLMGAALGPAEPWDRWIAILKAVFALPLSEADRAAFSEVAGGRSPPTRRVDEFWSVVGRRSGKTRIASAICVFIGAIERHKLAPGEVGHVMLIASSRDQARVAFNYVTGFLKSSPILSRQIESIQERDAEIRLKGHVVIGVHAGSYRTIRGRTLLGVVGDETSFWHDQDSAQPDVEIYRACMPALAASGGMWIGISTGYRKVGLLYQKWKEHFGHDGDEVLVIQGASQQFNRTLNAGVIARAKASDPEAAEAEWMGGFRSDVAAFLDDTTIDSVIEFGRPLEVPPRQGISYSAFADPSGGRHDAFTCCVGHREGSENHFFVADVIRGRHPPFDPHEVVSEYAQLCRDYNISSITGDNFAQDWVSSAFERAGIRYVRSEQSKSQLYLESLPQFARQALSIPDHPKPIRELRLLERRTSRLGRDAVDHPRNGSDDYANALCGALRQLAVPAYDPFHGMFKEDDGDPDGRRAWRVASFLQHVARFG